MAAAEGARVSWYDPVDSDKHYWHRYSGFYQRHFAALGAASSILEYGILQGASIGWLHRVFPQAEIFGVDIEPQQPGWPTGPGITYLKADQGDRRNIACMLQRLNRTFDLVIEDGSHVPAHQANCLAETFPYLRPGGLYVLEDLHAAHPQHSLYRTHCAAGTPDSLHLLLLIEHRRAADQALRAGDAERLSRTGVFTQADVVRLAHMIAEIDIFHRATLPLRCFSCGTDDFDFVALRCQCGVDLDILGADSMTAVLRRGTAPG
jgi:hypothetical protein